MTFPTYTEVLKTEARFFFQNDEYFPQVATNTLPTVLRRLTLPTSKRISSGVASAFPGGRAAHLEDQIEEENKEKLKKNGRK